MCQHLKFAKISLILHSFVPHFILFDEMLIEVVFICHCNATVHERVLRTCDDFVWPVDTTFLGRLIIDVEFLDLKIYPLNVSL